MDAILARSFQSVHHLELEEQSMRKSTPKDWMRQYLTPDTRNILRSCNAPQVTGSPENADMLGIGSIHVLSIRTQRYLMDLLQFSIFRNLQLPNGSNGKIPGALRLAPIHDQINGI